MLSLVRNKFMKNSWKKKGYSGTQKYISFPQFIPVVDRSYSYIDKLPTT